MTAPSAGEPSLRPPAAPTTSAGRRRLVAWAKDSPAGMEIARVRFADDSLHAAGTALVVSQAPFELRYALWTGAGYVTRRLTVRCRGLDWARQLRLTRDPSGRWTARGTSNGGPFATAPGEGAVELGPEVLDVDLESSPLFNTMPVLRHDLFVDRRSGEFAMAWVAIPTLRVELSRQRYTAIRRTADDHVIRFESLDAGTGFTSEVTFDRDGVVRDYPGIARSLN